MVLVPRRADANAADHPAMEDPTTITSASYAVVDWVLKYSLLDVYPGSGINDLHDVTIIAKINRSIDFLLNIFLTML